MANVAPVILVVEDEALLLWSIVEDLRDAGFDVFDARNADEALAKLESVPEIAVIFTDVNMPGSTDGLRLSAIVRDRWPPVKIIVTSGKEKPGAGVLPEGALFIAKPYFRDEVTAAIHEVLQ